MRRALGTAPVFALALLAGCPGQDAETTPVATAGGCELSVGWDPWEPYQYRAADGSVEGLDIEIIRLLAKDAGCELDYVQGTWLDLLYQLRDGRVEVLLAATIIPEREAYARFSTPYRQESFALYVRQEELPELAGLNLQQLAESGRRIGFTEGYYYGPDVNALATDPATRDRFVPASVVELNYSRLLDHSIDVLIDDPMVATSVIRRKGWRGQIARHPQVIASGRVSLMFSRSAVEEEIVRRFNRALTARQQDGTLARLTAQYES